VHFVLTHAHPERTSVTHRSKPSTLNFGVFSDELPEKKMQLIGMNILINPIKPWVGMSHLRGSFAFDSHPKSVSYGARFWGFWFSRVRGVLGGISSIPLDLASFGGQNHDYGLLMRCSYYPQSLVQVCGAIREIEVWIWRS
jgi:hypothetical protein